MKNKTSNKNRLLIVSVIGIFLITILGITYAWLTQVLNGTKVNRIKAGTLDLVLDDEASNGINLEYAVPQSDSQGLANTPYTFKVINNGTINADYKLYLEDEELDSGEERISDSNIKFNLKRNGNTVKEGSLSATIIDSKREIENVVINGGDTYNYSLVLWIDSETTSSEANKVFKAKIKLEAVQTEDIHYEYTNSHIKAAYTYNQNGTGTGTAYTGCLGGEESGCKQRSLISSDSVPVGTIIKYEVKSGVEKYFNVLYDNGTTLTMQQSENTIDSVKWYETSNNNTNGPITVLSALDSKTSDWEYVNDQTYTARTTVFGTGAYATANTACPWIEGMIVNAANCNKNTYQPFTKTNVKARLLTATEAGEMGCIMYNSNKTSRKTCKSFLNNYLYTSTSYGGSFDRGTDGNNYGYWTMTTDTVQTGRALHISSWGDVQSAVSNSAYNSARAVVVVNK